MKRNFLAGLLLVITISLLWPQQAQAVPIPTALGTIETKPTEFLTQILQFLFGISGGIAFLLMIFGSFQVILSSGNPDKVKGGQEIITSAVMGLLFIVFSVFILNFIGVEILAIPKIFD